MQINLLPWREQARQFKKARFRLALVTFAIIPAFFILLFHLYYSAVLNHQLAINNILQDAISKEQTILNQMSSEEAAQQDADTQLRFLMNLYKESYDAVRVLNDLVSLVPPSIFVTQIRRNGDEITLTGIADEEDDISDLMHGIAHSAYFNQPVLVSIALESDKQLVNMRRFKLKFEQKG